MMPKTPDKCVERSPISSTGRPLVHLPRDAHLLITTPSHVFSWDATGFHTIFKSRKSGIVAAREAKDGSGVLAVADRHTVVLHDTKRGQERSWGLHAEEDEVRYLEYAQDAKSMFFTTNLASDIQRYSTEQSRLLRPAQTHPSPPNAMAISCTGHLMVSASDSPPMVYLRSLAHAGAPIRMETRASDAAISVIAFHPERANVFLVAFRDGTIAAYDATKILRRNNDHFQGSILINDGEISHLDSVHRPTSKIVTKDGVGINPTSITAASFLPGYKTRAVTVGSDGRCKIIDFAQGGVVMRTWHANAPLTSVSVLSIKATRDQDSLDSLNTVRRRRNITANSHIWGGNASMDNLIAVARTDGKVHLYDAVGLLVGHKDVSEYAEKIISVEWIMGPSLPPMVRTNAKKAPIEEPLILKRSPVPKVPRGVQKPASRPQSRNTITTALGVPPVLRPLEESSRVTSPKATRKFTIHPDEEEQEGTVRHTPSPERAHNPVLVPGTNIMDLFSPVKLPSVRTDERAEKKVSSPPSRSRPRISSQTFLKGSTRKSPKRHALVSQTQVLGVLPSDESHATSTRSERTEVYTGKDPKLKPSYPESTTLFPLDTTKATIRLKSNHKPKSTEISNKTWNSVSDENAKVLAELRQMAQNTSEGPGGGVLQALAKNAVNRSTGGPPESDPQKRNRHRHVHNSLKYPGKQKAWHPGNVLERESTWPTDSMQDQSLHEDKDDIWLTSESESAPQGARRRRLQSRPSARQSPPSKVGRSDGSGSTERETKRPIAPRITASPKQAPLLPPPQPRLDGSTEDSELFTAATHLSPTGELSPSSADIYELFPRTSSLSPRRTRAPPPQKTAPRAPPAGIDHTLRARVSPNAARGRRAPQAKSPWHRVHAGKLRREGTVASVRRYVVPPPVEREDCGGRALGAEGLERTSAVKCDDCAEAAGRTLALEEEVARLKGEVLLLKSVLRRNGLPVPPGVR